MNTMVAARVPVEVKEQGDGILKSLGSNPTELINRAYAYVLKYGVLPGERERGEQANAVLRKVTPEMLDSLRATYEGMSLPLADAWDAKSFREIRDELQEDRYARFA